MAEVRVGEEALAPEGLHLGDQLVPVSAQALERVAQQVLEVVRAGASRGGVARSGSRVAAADGELAQDGEGPRAVVEQRAVEVEDDDGRRVRALGAAAPQDGPQHGVLLGMGRLGPDDAQDSPCCDVAGPHGTFHRGCAADGAKSQRG